MSISSNFAMQKISTPSTTRLGAVEEINPKLVIVLKKLLEPKFKLHNNDYLNLLLTHLTKNQESKLTPRQIESTKQFLLLWLKGSIIKFERGEEAPNSNLLTFVLNVTSYLCASEPLFVQLNSEDYFTRLIKIVHKVSQSNVITAYIKLQSNLMEHKSGLLWIMATKYWRELVNILVNNETMYVNKEGFKFVANLLKKSHSCNVIFCKNVIQYILMPLDNICGAITGNTTVDSDNRCLSYTLKLLGEILIILLGPDASANENTFILLFIENFNLEKRIKYLINSTNDVELKGGLYRIIIFLGLCDLKLKFAGKERPCLQQTDISLEIFNVLYEAANEVSVACMLQLLFTTLKCWSSIKATLPQSLRSKSVVLTFEDQLLAIQLMPMYTIFVKTIGFNVYTSEYEDSFRYTFISKLVDRIYPKTIRVKYKWQNYLLDNYSIKNGILALKYFIHTKTFYSKENAILAFQMMIYLIEDLNTTLKEKPQLQLQFIDEPEYLELHLKVIGIIIDDFNLTWRDTVESLCVLYIVYHLLNGFVWPTKVVVSALKLAEKGISKYMTFQMALLVDDSEDTVMNRLPALLRVKLFDGAWEVRDSTIELLQSLFVTTENTEFSSRKKLLLENDIPCSILRMATDDGNVFVRASALKCIQKAIKIRKFWEEVTGSCNIHSSVLRILRSETEGTVRGEAATLVDCIYELRNIPDDLMNDFYDVMSHAVVSDLHWEVRVKALSFWKRVIDDHLTEQGMIDGSFPNVTFSKELRKIINLSSVEVRKRLVRVLYELSQIGCLSVFYEALKDDCDIEVSKFATTTIKDFVDLLKNYDVTLQCLRTYAPPTSVTQIPELVQTLEETVADNFRMTTTTQFEPISDSIMDDILDTRDLNLLETVFNTLDQPVFENIETKKRKILQPDQFLNLVYTDLQSCLDEKSKWIEEMDSFQSLLDDILRDYEVTDVNSMDCY